MHRIEQSLLGQVSWFIEMHAVDLSKEPAARHVARIAASERQADYLCACVLAETVVIAGGGPQSVPLRAFAESMQAQLKTSPLINRMVELHGDAGVT